MSFPCQVLRTKAEPRLLIICIARQPHARILHDFLDSPEKGRAGSHKVLWGFGFGVYDSGLGFGVFWGWYRCKTKKYLSAYSKPPAPRPKP